MRSSPILKRSSCTCIIQQQTMGSIKRNVRGKQGENKQACPPFLVCNRADCLLKITKNYEFILLWATQCYQLPSSEDQVAVNYLPRSSSILYTTFDLFFPVTVHRKTGSTHLLIFNLVAPYMPRRGSILSNVFNTHSYLFL